MDRFWGKVDKTDTCWLWTACTHLGYGVFRDGPNRRTVRAHRHAWELTFGSIPDGKHLDHICHVRRCVRPDHLRVATQKQNMENLNGSHHDSKSGVRGVYFRPDTKKWCAQIMSFGKRVTKSTFPTMEDAEAWAIARRNEVMTYNDHDRIPRETRITADTPD